MTEKRANFEVIVGRSLPEDRAARYIGLVHGHDKKPKCRLVAMLKSQGLQANQDITFLTDGGEEVRALAELISPCGEHVLDWFHIAMRLTVLGQYAKGVTQHDHPVGSRLLAVIERVKWLLWHGNRRRAREAIERVADDVDTLDVDYPNLRRFAKATHEFSVYIAANAGSIINYGEIPGRRADLVGLRRVHGKRRHQQAFCQATADAMDTLRSAPAVANSHAHPRRHAPAHVRVLVSRTRNDNAAGADQAAAA